MGGGSKGNGKKAREGLVRACMRHEGAAFVNEAFAAARARFRSARMVRESCGAAEHLRRACCGACGICGWGCESGGALRPRRITG